MRSDRRRKALGRNDRAGIEAKRHRSTAELLNEQNDFIKSICKSLPNFNQATHARYALETDLRFHRGGSDRRRVGTGEARSTSSPVDRRWRPTGAVSGNGSPPSQIES